MTNEIRSAGCIVEERGADYDPVSSLGLRLVERLIGRRG